eukprot:scaffold168335_cov74-Cyclotella_meneghiniana.AAC.1
MACCGHEDKYWLLMLFGGVLMWVRYSPDRSSVPPGGTQFRLAWPGGGDSPRGVLMYDLKSGCFEPIATFGPPICTYRRHYLCAAASADTAAVSAAVT